MQYLFLVGKSTTILLEGRQFSCVTQRTEDVCLIPLLFPLKPLPSLGLGSLILFLCLYVYLEHVRVGYPYWTLSETSGLLSVEGSRTAWTCSLTPNWAREVTLRREFRGNHRHNHLFRSCRSVGRGGRE